MMTPEMEFMKIIASLLIALKGTPITMIAVMFFAAPWVAMFGLSFIQGRRLATVLDMHRNSIEAAKVAGECCRDYKEVMVMTIEKLTKVIESVDNNLYCPVVRKQTKQKEI